VEQEGRTSKKRSDIVTGFLTRKGCVLKRDGIPIFCNLRTILKGLEWVDFFGEGELKKVLLEAPIFICNIAYNGALAPKHRGLRLTDQKENCRTSLSDMKPTACRLPPLLPQCCLGLFGNRRSYLHVPLSDVF